MLNPDSPLVRWLIRAWPPFGGWAEGKQRARIQASPHWRDGRFHNPTPLDKDDLWGMVFGLFWASDYCRPKKPLPVVTVDPTRFAQPPASSLRITWLGHATTLVEIEGHRVLIDPIWSERASPFCWIGPRRWYPPLIPLDELPALDAVLISHDHYDHLDQPTIVAMKNWPMPFVVPLGIGKHLSRWGVPEARIVELDWWDRTRVGEIEIVATPARHASSRLMIDRDSTLWTGYALIGAARRVYYSGDSSLSRTFAEIGAKLGPFDLTMIPAGSYDIAWPDWHLDPEQAVAAHQMVRGRVLLPVHLGLFNMGYHGWTEPLERVLVAAEKAGVTVATPRPGESLEPAAVTGATRWWPDLPWQPALPPRQLSIPALISAPLTQRGPAARSLLPQLDGYGVENVEERIGERNEQPQPDLLDQPLTDQANDQEPQAD